MLFSQKSCLIFLYFVGEQIFFLIRSNRSFFGIFESSLSMFSSILKIISIESNCNIFLISIKRKKKKIYETVDRCWFKYILIGHEKDIIVN